MCIRDSPDGLPSEEEGLKGRAEAENLVGIYAALSGVSKQAVLNDFGGKQFSEFKPALAELALTQLSPVANEMRRLMEQPDYIDGILREGGQRASAIARPIMDDVKDILGFLR